LLLVRCLELPHLLALLLPLAPDRVQRVIDRLQLTENLLSLPVGFGDGPEVLRHAQSS
jgi:hypothetical protein